jgi:hypothetical protein
MKVLITEPKMDRTLNVIFDRAQRTRLDRIIEIGVRVENGDEKMLRRFARKGLNIIARVFGAQLGRTIARFGGGGTVQTPGIIAGVTKDWLVDALRGISVPELMARAVLDPKWEKVLLSRVPENPREIRRMIRWGVRPLINLQAGTIASVESALRRKGEQAEREGAEHFPGELE